MHLQPAVFDVPADGFFYALLEVVAWVETEFVDGGLYIATPISLFENVEFIFVERGDPSGVVAKFFSGPRDDLQCPDRRFDAYPPGSAQFITN